MEKILIISSTLSSVAVMCLGVVLSIGDGCNCSL